MIKRFLIPVSLFLALVSCRSGADEAAVNADRAAASAEETAAVTEVRKQTEPVEDEGMSKVLVSKGLIRSINEVNVYSRIEGQLMDVQLVEGQKVRKGQELFKLDDSEFRAKVILSEGQMKEASVRMDEILIGQGYKRGEFKDVPEDVLQYIRVKSGLNTAEIEYEINKRRLGRTSITAPQSGLVTGITPLPYSFVKPGETLCKIVDPEHLKVEFSILETELKRFELGKIIEIKAIAYLDQPYQAKVTSISTVVDESGMVEVEATLENPGKLLPGMTAIVRL